MNSKKPKSIKLTSNAIDELRLLVQRAEPGDFTLRQLHGEEKWQQVRPQALGLAFKAAVLRGQIPGIRWKGRRSNKAQLYEVLPRANTRAELKGTDSTLVPQACPGKMNCTESSFAQIQRVGGEVV